MFFVVDLEFYIFPYDFPVWLWDLWIILGIDLLNFISEEIPLSCMSCILCSCPNFKDSSFSLHTLAVLIKKGYLSQVSFEAQKRKGRKPQVPSAWTKDDVESWREKCENWNSSYFTFMLIKKNLFDILKVWKIDFKRF